MQNYEQVVLMYRRKLTTQYETGTTHFGVSSMARAISSKRATSLWPTSTKISPYECLSGFQSSWASDFGRNSNRRVSSSSTKSQDSMLRLYFILSSPEQRAMPVDLATDTFPTFLCPGGYRTVASGVTNGALLLCGLALSRIWTLQPLP